MATFMLKADIAAPMETVFEVLTDHEGYANFSRLRSSKLERPGTPEVNGVGAVRVLSLVGPAIREEVISYSPPRHFAYKALSGVPAKEHTGSVDLSPRGDGTILTWQVISVPKVSMPDRLWIGVVKPVIDQLLKGVVKESERRAKTSA